MYFLISPAKNLNETHEFTPKFYSQPALLDQAEILMRTVRLLAPQDIASLMKVSDKIALLNVERNQNWHTPFTIDNAKLALFMFNGDVYDGIAARQLNEQQIHYIHHHVCILSGLYGLLRPLDLMQAYRLEMGTALRNVRGKNLYEFWGEMITKHLNSALESADDDIVVNLASQEYFKVIQANKLNARVITPVFQDERGGKFKVISFYAKRARGLMVRYAAEKMVENVAQLKDFDYEGYAFNEVASSENEWVFQRSASYA